MTEEGVGSRARILETVWFTATRWGSKKGSGPALRKCLLGECYNETQYQCEWYHPVKQCYMGPNSSEALTPLTWYQGSIRWNAR